MLKVKQRLTQHKRFVRLWQIKYIIADVFSSALAWTLFFMFRKIFIEPKKFGYEIPIEFDKNYFLGIILIPIFWLVLYYLVGNYKNVFRKARLQELGQTFFLSIIGSIVIFFVLILDDIVVTYKTYYLSFFAYFLLHFLSTYFFRFILTSRIVYKVHTHKIGFNTLMVGSDERALRLYKEMEAMNKSTGNKFVGFININDNHNKNYLIEKYLPHLGDYTEMKSIINSDGIEEVIIAIESSEQQKIGKILNELYDKDIVIKVIPDTYALIAGGVKMNSLWSPPLIIISPQLLPEWQKSLKRLFDILASIVGIIIFSPIYLFCAIGIKINSKGPIIYSQERIGLQGRPFKMYKFRSMFVDAEKKGPELSSKNDPRITSFGKFLRKFRFDELPQFFNVLLSDMSFVGYRPERQYFIEQIIQKAPYYRYLFRIKPGMTSWGQVKFGYAENVSEMIERLKYDVMYLENMSLALDFKILINTVLIIFQGRGK